MIEYKITPIAVSVHRKSESPIFGEGVTNIRIDDEGGGMFLVISQEDKEIRCDIEELELILSAARELIAPHLEPGEKGSDA